jgi:hypothetical protein
MAEVKVNVFRVTGRWLVGLFVVGALIVPGAVASATGTHTRPATSHSGTSKEVEVYATYYGWYDNTPPGCATAYSGCAGGTGTYKDPITFASDKHEFAIGTILYYPTLEKYFVMGDNCQECDQDWKGTGPDGGPHLHHVDLWTGGKGGNEFDAINCEDALTQGMPNGDPILTPFITHPPRNLPVSKEPIFNAKTGKCFGGATTSTSYGRYENGQSSECLEDPGDSTTSGVSATVAPCSTGPAEDIAFDGAFFMVNGLCLQTDGGKPGAQIVFATCNGNDREQWEIDPNGTIEWVEYTICIRQDGTNVELAKCSTASSEQWTYTSEKSS